MLQLKNNTSFSTGFAFFPNLQGVDTLYVMVKATFVIGSQWTLSEKQLPIYQSDEYWGVPGESSLKQVGEYHIGKPATDILMYGLACPLGQRAVRQMDVGLEVGNIQKIVRVFGERRWERGQITSPELFANMPLVYERAFGGSSASKDKNSPLISYELNPSGKGFHQDPSESVDGVILPNIEYTHELIQHATDTPMPAGFGPIAPGWRPRAGLAGTYDQNWKTTRAPYLPDDFDPRFLNSAPADQIYSGFIKGGEKVRIVGMNPDTDFDFNLPYVNLVNKVRISGQEHSAPFYMETLALYPNQRCLTMTWRAALACGKSLLKIEEIVVNLSR